MDAWTIMVAAVGGWCVASLPLAVLIGHLIAGRSLRVTLGRPRAAVDGALTATVVPITALSERRRSLDSVV